MRKAGLRVTAILFALQLVLLPAAGFAQDATTSPDAASEEVDGFVVPEAWVAATVTGHVDGDKFTVEIDGNKHEVNLIGADAPEPGECMFDVSSRFLRNLLPVGSTVYLERDKKDKDGKKRLLRYVHVQREDSAEVDLINVRVIRYGYAGWVSKDGNTIRDAEFEAAQLKAQETTDGIWFECGSAHAEKPLLTCMMVPKVTMDAITAGFEEAFKPRIWKAVIARPHPEYPYIVAAVGPVSMMSDASDPDVAVWAVERSRQSHEDHLGRYHGRRIQQFPGRIEHGPDGERLDARCGRSNRLHRHRDRRRRVVSSRRFGPACLDLIRTKLGLRNAFISGINKS